MVQLNATSSRTRSRSNPPLGRLEGRPRERTWEVGTLFSVMVEVMLGILNKFGSARKGIFLVQILSGFFSYISPASKCNSFEVKCNKRKKKTRFL